MQEMKIDAVYLWCNLDDPNFKKQKAEMEKKLRIEKKKTMPSKDNSANDKERYSDNDELLYSLRSLEKFAPWINHIYVVTNNQRPLWLKESGKLTIVDHSEIIPKQYRPTFNSACIEQYIVKIPNLSEYFIYLNDDFFLNRSAKPEYFFLNNLPITRLKEPLHPFEKNKMIDVYRKRVLSAYTAVINKNNCIFPFSFITHGIEAYKKSILETILEKYPESYELSSTAFREEQNMHRVFWNYEMAYFFDCPLIYEELPRSILEKVKAAVGLRKIFNIRVQKDADEMHTIKLLKRYNPLCFCFNDLSNSKESLLTSFLKMKFTKKSSFEL